MDLLRACHKQISICRRDVVYGLEVVSPEEGGDNEVGDEDERKIAVLDAWHLFGADKITNRLEVKQ